MKASQLRASILQQAVEGKLVPQIPEEGTAADLLESIRAEREALIKAGKIKKAKPLPEITEDEIPFEIPESWRWVRLGDVAYLSSGNQYPEDNTGTYYVKVSDMNLPENQYEIVTSSRKASIPDKDIVKRGSIIFPKRGGAISTNKKRIVSLFDIGVDSNIMSMFIICPSTLPYVFRWFEGVDLGKLSTGTSIPQINNQDIYPLLLPLPPLAEQKRIVAKVEELMRVIDKL